MRFQILWIVLFGLSSGYLPAYAGPEFSSDCRRWSSVNPNSPPIAGYIKDKAGYIYFDFSKKIWMSLDQTPMVFVLRDNEVLILTPQSIEVISYASKHPDKIVELMSVISELGKKLFEESRWVFRLRNGETFLTGLLARNKSCTAAPNAKAILCRKNRPCSLVPPKKGADSLVSSCAKEFGLLEPTSVERLRRACSVIGGTTYESILRTFAKAKAACAATVPDLTPLQDMKRACDEGRGILSNLK